MNILLTNDDGYFSPGLKALAAALAPEHEVVIIAPEREHSGQSHAITIKRPLVVKPVELEGFDGAFYSVSGTPADCVRAGLDKIVSSKPDVIFSGCNAGYNAGMDIVYSGTFSAAMEGVLHGIPAVAVSARWVKGRCRYDTATAVAKKLFDKVKAPFLAMEKAMVLNLNVPYLDEEALRGLAVAEVGEHVYDYYFEEEIDGERRLSLRGRNTAEHVPGTDRYLLERDYATVTPLGYGPAEPEAMARLKSWLDA